MLIKRCLSGLSRDYWLKTVRRGRLMAPITSIDMKLSETKRLIMYGLNESEIEVKTKEEDPLTRAIGLYNPDLILLQIDPVHYMNRLKYIASKATQKKFEWMRDPEEFELEKPIPKTWEDCKVEMAIIDVIKMIESGQKLDFDNALSSINMAKSSEQIKDKNEQFQEFSQSIFKNILGGDPDVNLYIASSLIFALLQGNDVVLIDIPEPLYRIKLANKHSLESLREMVLHLIEMLNMHYKASEEVLTLNDMAYEHLPDIFQAPRDYYMAAFINEIMKENNIAVSFLRNSSYLSIQEIWQQSDPINLNDELIIPSNYPGDDKETLIEKHALLDIILEFNVWGQKYTRNPFPYIGTKAEITDELKAEYKNIFREKFNFYHQFVASRLKLPESLTNQSESDES